MKKLIYILMLVPMCAICQRRDSVMATTAQLTSFTVIDPVTKVRKNFLIEAGESLWVYDFVVDSWFANYKGQLGLVSEVFIKKTPAVVQYLSDKRERQKRILQEYRDSIMNLVDLKTREELKRLAPLGIVVVGYEEKISTTFGGFEVSFHNPSTKVIKYVWITTRAINPVGDLAVPQKTVQAVGPINPGDENVFEFEDIYYSKVIDKIKITKLKVQYMDGSIKELIEPNLSKARLIIAQ